MVELRANITFAPTTAAVSLHARIGIVDTPPGNLAADVDFDQAAAALLQPSSQLVNVGDVASFPKSVLFWAVDGIDPGAIITDDDVTISADLDSCARSWDLTIFASSGGRPDGDFVKTPLGYEIDIGGPPPGPRVPVDFALQLVGREALEGAAVIIPLLTGGYVDPGGTSTRPFSRESHTMSMSGGGREALYGLAEIDLKLPANHGLTHGELVIRALQAGQLPVPDDLIGVDPTIGAPRTVALDFRCAKRWPLIHEILRPLGLVVMASPEDGVFRAVSFDVRDKSPSVMTIGPNDITSSEAFETSASALGTTCFTVTGTRLQDTASGTGTASGTVTKTVVVTARTNGFQLRVGVATQDTIGGAITPTGSGGLGPPTDNVITNRVTVAATTVNGCPELTYTKIESYFNPPAARYTAAGTPDGQPVGYQFGYFFDSIPAVDDSQEMFTWSTERFTVISEVWERPEFDGEGVRDGTLTQSAGWNNPEAEIKNRLSAADPWETQNYVTPRFLSAGLSGLLFDRHRYFAGPGTPDALFPSGPSTAHPGLGFVVNKYIAVVDEDRFNDECLYEIGTLMTTTAYARRVGQLHFYADGTLGITGNVVGLETSERLDRVELTGGFREVKTSIDIEGVIRTQTTDGGQSGLPSAEVCTDDSLNREKQEQFTVRDVCLERVDGAGDPILDLSQPERLDSLFVETTEEANQWAFLELALLIALDVKIPLLSPNPALDVGKNVTVDLPEPGYPGIQVKIFEHETKISNEGTTHVLSCKRNLLA